MPYPKQTLVEHNFESHDLVGGDLVLDIVNTVTARDTAACDWLFDHETMLRWAALTQAFSATEIAAIRRLAIQRSTESQASLERLKQLREAIHRMLRASAQGRRAHAADITLVDDARALAARRARLSAEGASFRLSVDVRSSGLDLIADRIVLRAIDLLQSLPTDRLRVCAGRHCGWLFIDVSKAGRRRWCDMATCGTAQKYQMARRKRAALDGGQ